MAQSNGTAPPKGLATILEKIHAQRSLDVEQAKSTPGTSPSDINDLLGMNLAPPLISFVGRLRSGTKPALMAEIKRASPSKGDIALTANAASQALTYALGGASVISVLTEPKWFKGSLLDMRLARQAIDALPNRPAVLRKDFIFDEYQICEARLHGADTVLLIVAMLSISRLKELYAFSLSLGMEPLVEVNNAAEMHTAIDLGAKVIGVNNRNLHDFTVDTGNTSRLADMVQGKDVTLCALSGIWGSSDVRRYLDQGVGAVLVGESLMRAQDTKAFIRELLCLPPRSEEDTLKPSQAHVKVDGVTTVAEAAALAASGVEIIGVHLSPGHQTGISLTQAAEISLELRRSRTQFEESAAVSTEVLNESWFHSYTRRLSSALSKSRPLLVGIFDAETLDEIVHAVHLGQLDAVQLSPNTPLQWAKHIPTLVIRSLSGTADAVKLQESRLPGLHHLVQLECEVENLDAAKAVTELDVPVILSASGDLNEQSVREIVKSIRPWAIAGNAEVWKSGKGGVDYDLVGAFVNAVKAT